MDPSRTDERQRVAVPDHPVVADPVHAPPVLLSVALEPRLVGGNTIGTNAGSRPVAVSARHGRRPGAEGDESWPGEVRRF